AHQRRDGGESRDRGGECERTFWEAASHQLSFLAPGGGRIHTVLRRSCRKRFRNSYQVELDGLSEFFREFRPVTQIDYRNVPENDSMDGCRTWRSGGHTERPA